MSSRLYEVRRRIRETENSISTKRKYIKDKKVRFNDVESVIRIIYGCFSESTDINRKINSIIDEINNAIYIERIDFSTPLEDIQEKYPYNGSKLSSAASELEWEKRQINSQIESANREIISLNYRLDNLEEEKRRLIIESIQND